MRQLSFKRHRFLPDIISHAIWLYARFTLSFRDVSRAMVAAWVEDYNTEPPHSAFGYQTPGLVGDVKSTLRQEVLHVPIAERKEQLQPHGTLYDVGRKSMAGVGDFPHADP